MLLRWIIAALAVFALGCAPAMAQSAFLTPGGSMVDGKAIMCPNVSGLMVPCGSVGQPVNIAGSFSATLAGWQPTPSYSQLAASDALNHSVAVPSGPDDVVMNLDTNVVYCNAGAAATVNTYPIQPGSAVAWHNPGGTTFTTVQCLSPTSSLKITIAGGTGLWTAAGGGGGSGGSLTWPGTAGNAVGGASPTTGTMPYVNSILVGINGSGTYLPVIMSATQGVKVSSTDVQSSAGTPNATVLNVQGNASGVPIPISGTVSASFSGFNSGGVYATPLAVSGTSSSVAAPAGSTVVVFNTGSVPVFTTIHATSATATTAMDQISPGGCWAYVQTGSELIAGITATGTSTLNISGGSGWPVGCGGGGGSGGGTVSQGSGNPANPWTVTPLTGSTFNVSPANTFPVVTNIDQGTNSVAIDSSTSGTAQLIAAPGSGALYITQWWVSAPSGTFKLVYGTGSNCATGTTELFGPVTMNGGQSGAGGGAGSILFVPAGNALCTVLSASVQYSGSVSYLNR